MAQFLLSIFRLHRSDEILLEQNPYDLELGDELLVGDNDRLVAA